MKKTIRNRQKFECPDCGSNNTQSIELAYSQSIRTGALETRNGLTEDLAPPKERDEKVWPRIVMCVVFSMSLLGLPWFLDHTGIEILYGLSSFSIPVILVSLVLGLSAGLALALPAIRHNVYATEDQYEKWRAQAICRRCGSIFPTNTAGLANAEKSRTDV